VLRLSRRDGSDLTVEIVMLRHEVAEHNDFDGQIRVVGPIQAEHLDVPEKAR